MSILKPTIMLEKVTDISSALLSSMGVKVLLLDVDNTISAFDSKLPLPGSVEWAHRLSEEGFAVYIVSNNYKHRVEGIASVFGLPFVSFAMKPLPIGFLKVKHKLGLKSRQCLVVGDQIFTDIMGAALGGMPSVLLTPIKPETGRSFKIRRGIEARLRPRYRKEIERKKLK